MQCIISICARAEYQLTKNVGYGEEINLLEFKKYQLPVVLIVAKNYPLWRTLTCHRHVKMLLVVKLSLWMMHIIFISFCCPLLFLCILQY